METKTIILTPEQEFRQMRQNGSYAIQISPDNWVVTDFSLESGLYNVIKRSYSYKIIKTMPDNSENTKEFCIMGDSSIQELNKFFENSNPTIVNFMGRPGAGKGTHGGHFAEMYNLPSVKTGELIRMSQLGDTTINTLADGFVDEGIHDNPGKSICLDGYPRNFAQRDHLLSYLSDYNIFTVFLNANKEECLKRISNRYDSHTCDRDPKLTEKRMEKYGQYTRKNITFFKEESYSTLNTYYAEIFIVSGATKDENFKNMMAGMLKAVKNKASWIKQQQIRNTDLQK